MSYKKQLFYLIQEQPFLTAVFFFLVYVLASTVSLPGTTVLSIAGGFLFGFAPGLLISLFAVSLGSGFAFLITRHFLRDFFVKKAGSKLEKLYSHLEQDETYYLFAFRLFPFTPLFFTNMLMGLTSMRLNVFFTVSFIAFLPTLFVYVNMGSQLSRLEDWSGLSDPSFLFAFALMGLFPLTVRYSFKFLKRFKKSREEFSLDSEQIFLN
ncbi:MAG: VTT domain-containing protein [Oligoflexia bacterium]|nr:VTT domain-containing protein [Oligoflexia bacterium]